MHRLNLTGDYNSTRNGAAPGDDMPDSMARSLRQHYYAAVSFTDDNIGGVLAALQSSGASTNTVVALWAGSSASTGRGASRQCGRSRRAARS